MTRFFQFVGGLLITTLGVKLMALTSFGISPWDSVNFGVSSILDIGVGQAAWITSLTVLFISSLINRKMFKLTTIITAILIGYFIDGWTIILGNIILRSFLIKVLVFIIGILVYSLGVCIYLKSEYPQNPIDYLMITIKERFSLKIEIAKLIIDIFSVVCAYIIGGTIGLGTIVITLIAGPLIGQFTRIIFKKVK